MATTTHTPLREDGTSAPEAPGPRKERGRFAIRRGAFT
jgi:hypothetical protein